MDSAQGGGIAGGQGSETAEDIFLETVCVDDVRHSLPDDAHELPQDPEPVQLRFIQHHDIDTGIPQSLFEGAVVEYDDTDVYPQVAQGGCQGMQLHLRTRPQVTGGDMEDAGSIGTGQDGSFLMAVCSTQPPGGW